MKHFSLDIETLSSEPTAAVLSIGLYEISGIEKELDKDRLFYVNIDLNSCTASGLKVSDSSFRWWLKQSDYAKVCLSNPGPVHLQHAIRTLSSWWGQHKDEKENLVWAHATFDFPVLHNAMQVVGFAPPWGYRNCFDLRTLLRFVNKNGKLLTDLKHDNPKEHDAGWDAFAQGQIVAQILEL